MSSRRKILSSRDRLHRVVVKPGVDHDRQLISQEAVGEDVEVQIAI